MRNQIPTLLLLMLCWIVSSASLADPTVFDAYRGKVVLVDFWASWCGPCLRSFPWLNRMQAKYADQGLVVLGVNMDKNRADARNFMQQLRPQFKILFDDSAALAHQFDVKTMPSTFVLDRDGRLVIEHHGFTTKGAPKLERKLQAILENSQVRLSDANSEMHTP